MYTYSSLCTCVGWCISQHYEQKDMKARCYSAILSNPSWDYKIHMVYVIYIRAMISWLNLHLDIKLVIINIQHLSSYQKWAELCGVTSWEHLWHLSGGSLVWTNIAWNIYFSIPQVWQVDSTHTLIKSL